MDNAPPPIAGSGQAAQNPQSPIAGIAIASLVLGILSLTCMSIVAGIPALICGAIALGRIRAARGTLSGQGLAIAGVVTGGLSILMIPILAALLLPALTNAREKARQAQCLWNEKQIACVYRLYKQDHDGKAPQTWTDLRPYGVTDAILHCPSARDRSACSYRLIPGTNSSDVIVREDLSDHRRGSNVAHEDGYVEWVPANKQ